MSRRPLMAGIAWQIAAALLVAGAGPAPAGVEGHRALAIGVIVGAQDPGLAATSKSALAMLIADSKLPPSMSGTIIVRASSIICGAGNADIAKFFCTLAFGAGTVALSGRVAHELFATLAEAGVPMDGGAGTIYRGVRMLNCTINPAEVNDHGGGGAACTFQPG